MNAQPYKRFVGFSFCLLLLALGLCNFTACYRFNAGPSLVGGTDWVYELDVSDFPGDTHGLSQHVIEILKKRIDPDGTQNIVWHAPDDTHIEVQMPPASSAVRAARKELHDAQSALQASNLNMLQVNSAIDQTGDKRKEALDKLAVPGTLERAALEKLAAAADAQHAAEQTVATFGDPGKVPGPLLDTLFATHTAYSASFDEVKNFNIDVNQLTDLAGLADGSSTSGMEAGKQLDAILDKPEFSTKKPMIQKLIAASARLMAQSDSWLDDPDELERELRTSGVLDFRIAVERTDPSMVPIIEIAHTDLEKHGSSKPVVGAGNVQWFEIDPVNGADLATDTLMVLDKWGGINYILLYTDRDHALTHDAVREWKLTRARASTNPETGKPIVEFWFDPSGTRYFGKLTFDNVAKPLAILLDNKAIQAPHINDAITGGAGEITFGDTRSAAVTKKEAETMAKILDAGSLPVPLKPEPIFKKTIGP